MNSLPIDPPGANSPLPQGPPIRWRIGVVIACLGLALLLGVRFAMEDNSQFRHFATVGAVALTGFSLAVWAFFFAGFSGRVKRGLILAAIVTTLVFPLTFRVRRFTGDVSPVFAWRCLNERVLAEEGRQADLARRLEALGPPAAAWMSVGIPLGVFLLFTRRARSAARWPLIGIVLSTCLGGNAAAYVLSRGARPVDLGPSGPSDAIAWRESDVDYPRFLGPERTGIARGPRLARDWNTHPPKRLWRRSIGEGWSAFAIVGEYAVTQERWEDEERIVCYRVADGEIVWSHADPGAYESAVAGNGPRATPTIESGRVYAVSSLGLLNCLDATTGRRVWSHDLPKEYGTTVPEYGFSGSPLLSGGLVIIAAGVGAGPSLVAYRADSGELAWKGGSESASYSSPEIATLLGVPQILIVNAHSVTGHDPQSGDELWRYDWPGEMPKVPQPVPLGDHRVFIGAGYGVGSNVLEISRDDHGDWSAETTWPGGFHRKFKPKFTNVIHYGEYLYGIDDGLALACLHESGGRLAWRMGRYGHGQILLSHDLLLVQADSGDLAMVEANPKVFRELGRTSALVGQTWNHPALAGKYLLTRNDKQATCLELALESESP